MIVQTLDRPAIGKFLLMAMPFGEWLKAKRLERGLTIVSLAEKVGVSHAHISKIENGKGEAHKDTVVEIARALGVPPAEALMAYIETEPLIPEITRVRDDEEAQIIHSYRGISSPNDKAFVREMLEKMRRMDSEDSIGGRNADDLPDTEERERTKKR